MSKGSSNEERPPPDRADNWGNYAEAAAAYRRERVVEERKAAVVREQERESFQAAVDSYVQLRLVELGRVDSDTRDALEREGATAILNEVRREADRWHYLEAEHLDLKTKLIGIEARQWPVGPVIPPLSRDTVDQAPPGIALAEGTPPGRSSCSTQGGYANIDVIGVGGQVYGLCKARTSSVRGIVLLRLGLRQGQDGPAGLRQPQCPGVLGNARGT